MLLEPKKEDPQKPEQKKEVALQEQRPQVGTEDVRKEAVNEQLELGTVAASATSACVGIGDAANLC